MAEMMTSRERWLAALRCQPVDRLPFWPKINDAYVLNQKQPFLNMSTSELHRWIGSDQHVAAPTCVKTVRTRTSVEQTQTDAARRSIFRTPEGTLASVENFDPASGSWHPTEFPVKTVDDIEAMSLLVADARYEFDVDQFERATELMEHLGESGIAFANLGISPLMEWIQHIAGIETGLLLLSDCPEEVEGLLQEMHSAMCRCAEIMADKSPCLIIYSVENTSTTLISPRLFVRYCHQHLREYGRIIDASGKFHLLHMCGHLKALLFEIARLPAAAIEAFTSPPVGDTTLLDGRTACPEKCLIGGTNAASWLEPAETIIKNIERDLRVLPHCRGIVLTSAGVMPPQCSPETIRQVAAWVKSYTVI